MYDGLVSSKHNFVSNQACFKETKRMRENNFFVLQGGGGGEGE
jgi:hypothetical protein